MHNKSITYALRVGRSIHRNDVYSIYIDIDLSRVYRSQPEKADVSRSESRRRKLAYYRAICVIVSCDVPLSCRLGGGTADITSRIICTTALCSPAPITCCR